MASIYSIRHGDSVFLRKSCFFQGTNLEKAAYLFINRSGEGKDDCYVTRNRHGDSFERCTWRLL